MTDIASNPNRLQFSIRHILVTTTVVATAVGATETADNLVAAVVLNLLAASLCSLAILAALMTRGKVRTFWIGAAIPAFAGVVYAALVFESMESRPRYLGLADVLDSSGPALRCGLPPVWLLALANGLLCVFLHGLIWPGPQSDDASSKCAIGNDS
jgi:hypothetical protein